MFPSLVQILGDLLQDNSLPVKCSLKKKQKKQMTMFFFKKKKKSSAPSQTNPFQDGKDYVPLNQSQSSEDDGFSQPSSRPPSEEELKLACNTLPNRYGRLSHL